jgi:hypothetical protein
MPDIIPRALQEAPLLVQWFQWGVVVAFLLALGVTTWIFIDAHRSAQDATIWKSLGAVASVMGIPALLVRLHAGFAFEMRDSLAMVAIFSMAATVLAVVTAIGYASTRGPQGRTCRVCGQLQDPTWTRCPFHAMPDPVVPIASPTPITAPAPPSSSSGPVGGSSASAPSSGRETLVNANGSSARSANPSSSSSRSTVILNRDAEPEPIAFLIIRSGPYANTTLTLKEGVNTLGRDGRANDHAIDDPAVSERHLSLRYQDRRFTATDLDSSNGSFINNQRIEKQILHSNDIIRIGNTELAFVQIGEPSPSQDTPTSEASS